MDVLLFQLTHPRWEFVFQPTYAAYLNLIEPWWKILRSLARKGPLRLLGGHLPGHNSSDHLLAHPQTPLHLGPPPTPPPATTTRHCPKTDSSVNLVDAPLS